MDRTTPRPLNFIFFLADDLGWGDLGCYGHDVSNFDLIPERPIRIETPNLDRLAAEGKLFTDFYVNSPMCSPSRASMLTGNFPARHRIHFWMNRGHNRAYDMPDWLDPAATTLPRLLQGAGYATAHFGKWHLGDGDGAPEVASYGFDECRILCQGNGPRYPVKAWDPRATGLIVDDVIDFAQRHREGPFYVNAWPLDVHAPLEPTEESLARYSHLMSGTHQTAMQVYFAAVTAMDREIGRLIGKIDEMGLGEKTIFIFSSDNGPEDIYIPHAGYHAVGLPGPFRGRKRSLYRGGVRTPFVVRRKGAVPAEHVDSTTVLSGVDLLPSICALAGARLPRGYRTDGEDLSDTFCGAARRRTTPLMWEWRFHGVGQMMNRSPMLAIRDGDWKLLLNPNGSRTELYDMRTQAMELHSVAERHPDVVRRLSAAVRAWQGELPAGYTIESPGGDTYRWPREITVTAEDARLD